MISTFTVKCSHQGKIRVPLQEAKEDAEMDAEIALEMALERQRRVSTTSNNSSAGGTYVGPCPHSPGQVGTPLPYSWVKQQNVAACVSQYVLSFKPLLVIQFSFVQTQSVLRLCGLCLPLQEEEVQYGDQDLLSPRKMSVCRMHSLPNDSYMFRPVRPASAPYPLEEVELSPQHQHSGICSGLNH